MMSSQAVRSTVLATSVHQDPIDAIPDTLRLAKIGLFLSDTMQLANLGRLKNVEIPTNIEFGIRPIGRRKRDVLGTGC